MEQPRELTETEVRDKFLEYCNTSIKYWENLPNKSLHERMKGAVFSILVAIDGESASLPAFILAPFPHSDDREFRELNNENWYPENSEEFIDCDIAGALHEYFSRQN
jgi:hypothetical protein